MAESKSVNVLVPYSDSENDDDLEVESKTAERLTNKELSEAKELMRLVKDTYETASESSDSESSSEFSDSDKDVIKNIEEKPNPRKNQQSCKIEGDLIDLPPVEHLTINPIENKELELLGTVKSIIDRSCLVVVESLHGKAAIDFDSVVFNEKGEYVGRVFDIFGPVSCPLYSLRYNNFGEISERNLSPNVSIYYVPQQEQFTKHVFTDRLRKMKGSDASWKHDNEVPRDLVDYSDDEEERLAKTKNTNKTRPVSDQMRNLNQSRPPMNHGRAFRGNFGRARPPYNQGRGMFLPNPRLQRNPFNCQAGDPNIPPQMQPRQSYWQAMPPQYSPNFSNSPWGNASVTQPRPPHPFF